MDDTRHIQPVVETNTRTIKRSRLMQRLPVKSVHSPDEEETVFKNIKVGVFNAAAKRDVGGIARGSPNCKRPIRGYIRTLTDFLFMTDGEDVLWIAYVILEDCICDYIIRCDIDSVDIGQLSDEFKAENDLLRPEFNGDSIVTEYVGTAWALAFLNPCPRGHRDVLIRAVIGFYHCSRDPHRSSRRWRVLEAAGWEQTAPSNDHGLYPLPPPSPEIMLNNPMWEAQISLISAFQPGRAIEADPTAAIAQELHTRRILKRSRPNTPTQECLTLPFPDLDIDLDTNMEDFPLPRSPDVLWESVRHQGYDLPDLPVQLLDRIRTQE